jgi:hypothetical protein
MATCSLRTTQMRGDHPEIQRQIGDDALEVAGRVHDPVEENQRLAPAHVFVEMAVAIDGGERHP